MQNGLGWRKAVVAVTLLATGLVAVPQTATARDRCDRNDARYRNSGSYSAYRNDGYRYRQNRGYSNNAPYAYGSSSPQYRNSQPYFGDDGYYGYEQRRSSGKSAAIIGGGAAAGAAVGAMTGGKKGAIIGGVVGGLGGLIYDRKTRGSNRGYGW